MVTKAKLSSSKKKQTKKTTTSSRKKHSVGGKVGPIAERMDAKEWAKLFDIEVKNKKFDAALKMVNEVRGIKRWQKLNLLSSIAAHQKDLKLCEDYMRQAIRESDCGSAVKRNLAALLVSQGKMAE